MLVVLTTEVSHSTIYMSEVLFTAVAFVTRTTYVSCLRGERERCVSNLDIGHGSDVLTTILYWWKKLYVTYKRALTLTLAFDLPSALCRASIP